MSFFVRRSAGLLRSVLPLLVVLGLGLLGGGGHPGQLLRRAALLNPPQDAPMPTAPQAERRAYTRELHREDLRIFQAKIDHWQAAAQIPGEAGRHAQVRLAQWQRRSHQMQQTLNRQAQAE